MFCHPVATWYKQLVILLQSGVFFTVRVHVHVGGSAVCGIGQYWLDTEQHLFILEPKPLAQCCHFDRIFRSNLFITNR